MTRLMKNLYTALIIIIFLSGIYQSAWQPWARQSAIVLAQGSFTGIIKGTVIDKSSDRKISGAKVSVKQSGSDAASFTTSDDGVYLLQVPPGDYNIEASKRGFKNGVDKVKVASFETITKDISLVQVKTETDARQTVRSTGAQTGSLNTTGSFPGFVKGEVFDKSKGERVFGATVSLRQLASTIASAVTQEDGVYFFQVPPGGYDITAVKSGFDDSRDDISVSAFETVTKNINLELEVAVTPVPTPKPAPTPTPQPIEIGECEGGGAPVGIVISPETLTIKAGRQKRAKIRVLKDEGKGCSIEVGVQCIEGCDNIQLQKDTVTTNRRGFATVRIKADRNAEGMSIVLFSIDDIVAELPVVIE